MPQTPEEKAAKRLERVTDRLARHDALRHDIQHERDALVLELHGFGWTYQRIADISGQTTGNVFHILERARRASEKAKVNAR